MFEIDPSENTIFSHFRNSSNHSCPFLQQRQQQHHHSPPHNRLYHPPTNSNVCPLSMGSTVPLQHHPPHPGPPVIIDVDQIPDHVRAVPVTSLPNSLLVASVPVAAPTYIQPHQPPVSRGLNIETLMWDPYRKRNIRCTVRLRKLDRKSVV